MTEWEQALAACEPRPLDQLFDELVQAGRRWRRGDPTQRPLLTLHLHSGRDITGSVLDQHEPRVGHARTLLISRRGHGRGPDTEVLLVPQAHVEAVTLHELPRSASPTSREAPSPLQLKRRAKALGEQVAAMLGVTVTIEVGEATDDAAASALGAALEALATVLEGVCADALGRDALKATASSFRVTTGAGPALTLRDGWVTITAATASDHRLTADALKPQLEALL